MAKVKANACARSSCSALLVAVLFLIVCIAYYFTTFWPLRGTKQGTCIIVQSFITDEFSATCDRGKVILPRYVSHDCLIIEVNLDESGPPKDVPATEVPFEDERKKIFHSVRGFQNKNQTPKKSAVRTRILYENKQTLADGTCSFFPRCNKSSTTSELDEKVLKHKDRYGIPGMVFICSYHEEYPDKALRTTSDQKFRIYWFLGPGIAILVCVIILIYLAKKHAPLDFLTLTGIRHILDWLPCCNKVPDEREISSERTRNQNSHSEHEMQALNSQKSQNVSGINPTAPQQPSSPSKGPPDEFLPPPPSYGIATSDNQNAPPLPQKV